jgi:RecQ family ATP-dependent DNA helicase
VNAGSAAIVGPVDTREALRSIFGFEQFRPGQAEAVAAALDGRDALVVMPTGSGKSLCYQLPALMRRELTIVVSPLVSLMADQVAALERLAPGKVALVNSQRDAAANASVLERAASGELRLMYVAPERFGSRGFADAVTRIGVGLFVVDEAHCVSQWGHDFRPDYFTLAAAARGVGARSTLALTATATPEVAGDIARRLELRDPVRVSTGFDRPNLSFAVVPCANAADKRRRLAAALAEPGALPAIVYAGTRSACEELAGRLGRGLGVAVAAYHAGLDRATRTRVQEQFMAGELPVIVATNAFGMGIDKADVHTVCHATVPGSLEAYYQEAGRAGRDGAPARCLLFAEQRDKGLHVFFIQRAREERSAAGSAREAEQARWRQYRAIWAYVERSGCRRRALLAHFGDRSAPAPVGLCCDVCDPAAAPVAPSRVQGSPAATRSQTGGAGPGTGELDGAIMEVVQSAAPPVGRTRAVEILRGGRSKVIARYAYDGLPGYGAFSHLCGPEVLQRVDRLLEQGALRSTGGRFPKLRAA